MPDSQERSKEFDAELLAAMPRIKNLSKHFGKENWEDFQQDLLVRVMHSWKQYELHSKMHAWLYVIARSIHINNMKRAKRVFFVEIDSLPGYDIMEDTGNMTHAEAHTILRETSDFLSRIKPHMADSLMLRAQGYEQDEIAEMRNIAHGTVKSRVFRGHAALKELMGADR